MPRGVFSVRPPAATSYGREHRTGKELPFNRNYSANPHSENQDEGHLLCDTGNVTMGMSLVCWSTRLREINILTANRDVNL